MQSIIKNYIIGVLFLASAPVFCQAQELLAVIANTKGSPPQLELSQLQSVLKGEKQRWTDGTKVVIALMKTNTMAGVNTSKKVFKMSGDQLNRYWLALVFQGKADAPTFFNSENELENFVTQTPGAIGVIGASSASAAKTILIDGRRIL